MNRPMRKLIAFSAAAAMLANVPLMGANAKYVAEQVTDKEFETMVQFPDRNVYIENGTAKEFDADQQLVVVGTDGTTKLVSLKEGIAGSISYASTTMGIYDIAEPQNGRFGFNFNDPTYRLSLSNGTMVISLTDRQVLVDAEGKKIAEYYTIRPIYGTFYEVITLEGEVGVINSDGKVIIAPSAEILCVYLTADGKNFMIDGDGKDYFTDLTGKAASAVYGDLICGNYSSSSYTPGSTIPAATTTDYRLKSNYFKLKKDDKYAIVGGSKFEVLTDYFESVTIGSDYWDSPADCAFYGKNKLYDENGEPLMQHGYSYCYSTTYYDENGKVIQTKDDFGYDSNVYDSTYLSYGKDGESKPYLLSYKNGKNYEYDKLLDTKENVLLEGDEVKSLTYGVCVEKDGKFTLYNGNLEKIGVFNQGFDKERGIQLDSVKVYLGVTDEKSILYDQYFDVLIDDLPATFTSATSITKYDEYYNSEILGYAVSGKESVRLYDADCKLIKSKALAEGQTFEIIDGKDIFVYDSGWNADRAGENFYLSKEGSDTAKLVDIDGKTIVEVPASLKALPNGCFFESKDGVLTFYDKTGKELRKFNTDYNFTAISYSTYDISATADLSNIVMNGTDEATGKLTTTVYDLNKDTVKFTQTGKYDKVEALDFGLIKTTIYPEDYVETTRSAYYYDESALWTDDSGILTGLLNSDGTEVIAPTSSITLGTSKYCFGGYSSAGYRDLAIDIIYNDGVEMWNEDPFNNPAVDNPDVDGYIVLNGVYIPKKDFAPDYAKAHGYDIAISTRCGSYVVIKDGKWALADSEGKLLCDAKYSQICEFADGIARTLELNEVTCVAEYRKYIESLNRYVEKGEEYIDTVQKVGIITKDGTVLCSEPDTYINYLERYGDTYYTIATKLIDSELNTIEYKYGIYKGKEYFNDFTAKYGYDTAAQYGTFWLVSKDGLKGIVTDDNEVVLPVEFAEIMFVPTSEKIVTYFQPEEIKEALADQHYSAPISDLDDGSKLVNVKTKDGKIKAYKISEETTTSTSATTTTTTSATTTTTTSATTTTTTSTPTTTTTTEATTTEATTTEATTTEATTTKATTTEATTTEATTTEATTTEATTTEATTTEASTTSASTTTVAPDSIVGTWRFVKTLAADGTEVVNSSDMESTIELREDNSGILKATSDSEHEEYEIKWRKEGDKVIISTTEPNEDVMTLIYDSEKQMFAAPESDAEDAMTAYFKKDGVLPLGDINGDDKIDAKDASAILVEYSKMSTGGDSDMSDAQKAAANVNGDDKVDAKDASAILAYYALVSTASGDIPTMKEFITQNQA